MTARQGTDVDGSGRLRAAPPRWAGAGRALLSAAVLAVSLLALGAAPAAANPPCWKVLINDWYDGHINNTYPIHCYREAIQHLPADVQTYSSARDDITRALQSAIRHRLGGGGGASFGGGSSGNGGSSGGGGTHGSGGGGSQPSAGGPPSAGEPQKGFFVKALDKLGPKNADSVPLPLLILALIAFVLLAAGAAGFIVRRLQKRRPRSKPAPVGPAPERRELGP